MLQMQIVLDKLVQAESMHFKHYNVYLKNPFLILKRLTPFNAQINLCDFKQKVLVRSHLPINGFSLVAHRAPLHFQIQGSAMRLRDLNP